MNSLAWPTCFSEKMYIKLPTIAWINIKKITQNKVFFNLYYTLPHEYLR